MKVEITISHSTDNMTIVWFMNKSEVEREVKHEITDEQYDNFLYHCTEEVHAQLDMDIIYDAAMEEIKIVNNAVKFIMTGRPK